jgi:predicted secreted protein
MPRAASESGFTRTAGYNGGPEEEAVSRSPLAWSCLPAAALALLAPAVRAADETPLRRVEFSVQGSRDVANDWARAVVGVTDEDEDAARLADRVNQAMSWAGERARAKPGVVAKTGGYATHPVNDPRRGERRFWRASQDLVLESADARALSELVGELQSRLLLRSLDFTVSPERRRKVEDELIDEALAAFSARAERVRTRLGARGYEIGQISISTSGQLPPIPVMRAMEMDARQVAAPAFEPGTSELVVNVTGSIVLE